MQSFLDEAKKNNGKSGSELPWPSVGWCVSCMRTNWAMNIMRWWYIETRILCTHSRFLILTVRKSLSSLFAVAASRLMTTTEWLNNCASRSIHFTWIWIYFNDKPNKSCATHQSAPEQMLFNQLTVDEHSELHAHNNKQF